jgi:hypothetical protein
MAKTLSAAQSEIALDRLHRRSKIGTTLLFGTRFMRVIARWKDNFMNFNFEGCFATCALLEVREKTVEDEVATKDGIEVGDDNMTKDWNHGLMIIRRS